MKKNIPILCMTVLPLWFAGCAIPRYIYSSTKLNNAYLKQKGDTKITAAYSAGTQESNETSRGADLQSAVAVSNHLAVMASYSFRKEHDRSGENYDFDTSSVRYTRNIWEAGLGYYLANPEKTISGNLFAGAAFGKFSLKEQSLKGTQSFNFFQDLQVSRYYIQPSINFSPGRYIRFAYIFRMSFVHYGKSATDYSEIQLERYHLDVAGKTIRVVEQELNFQAGLPQLPWLKIDFSLFNAEPYHPYGYYVRGRAVSIGLNFEPFAGKKKKS